MAEAASENDRKAIPVAVSAPRLVNEKAVSKGTKRSRFFIHWCTLSARSQTFGPADSASNSRSTATSRWTAAAVAGDTPTSTAASDALQMGRSAWLSPA